MELITLLMLLMHKLKLPTKFCGLSILREVNPFPNIPFLDRPKFKEAKTTTEMFLLILYSIDTHFNTSTTDYF